MMECKADRNDKAPGKPQDLSPFHESHNFRNGRRIRLMNETRVDLVG